MTRLSGQVTLSDSPVQGVPVAVIDTNNSEDPTNWSIVATDVTDANGDWQVTGLSQNAVERYHALVQYDDGSQLYNVESLPYLSTDAYLTAPVQTWEWDGPTATISTPGIPDSVVLQYYATTWNSGDTTWVDDTGTADITVNGGPTDGTLSDGADAISTDGTDDSGELPLPAQFEGIDLNEFSIEVAGQYSHSNENIVFGLRNQPSGQFIHMFANRNENNNAEAGNFHILIRDQDGNGVIASPDTNPNINDGNRHDISIIINDASASDASIIIDGTDVSVAYGDTQNADNFGTWDRPLRVWARDLDGSVGSYMEMDMGAMRWHDKAITSQTISDYS